jgi:hypothetical protein
MAMKKANKAALYSALVFPGLGLLWLKSYKRAFLFIIPTTVMLWYLCSTLYNAIAPVYAKMLHDAEEGLLVIDPSNLNGLYITLYQEVQQSITAHQTQLFIAKTILIVVWICSIVASYFVGKKLDVESPNTPI